MSGTVRRKAARNRLKATINAEIGRLHKTHELLYRIFDKKVYNEGDGSPEERLQKIYVDAKHMDRMISGSKLPEEATAGVWINNAGLSSWRTALSYVELHAILVNMHGLAEKLSKLDAPQARQRQENDSGLPERGENISS